jgi:hypothetical protein
MRNLRSTPLVRRATPEDAHALARYAFRASIGAAVEDEPAFVARCAAWMRARLAAEGSWHRWLVESEAAVAGHLWLHARVAGGDR